MPGIDFYSEIMYRRTGSKYSLNKVVCSEPALVFDYSHAFGTSYGVLHPYPERRDFPVVFFFLCGKFLSFGLFHRLYNGNPIRTISLISSVLIQYAGIWKRIHGVSYLFIMYLSTKTRADKKQQAAGGSDYGILEGVFLFLTTVIFLLIIRINRARNLPLSAVMQQNGRCISFFGEFFKYLRKLSLALGWHDPSVLQTVFKNGVQGMNKAVTMLLIHSKTSGMVFLKWVVFQINQYKEQAVFHRGKRTIFINRETAPAITEVPFHIVTGKVLVMSFSKIGKQFGELLKGKTRQRTKALGVILMFGIFHRTKVRTHTEYKKSNLH
jgi:hypothetical protein